MQLDIAEHSRYILDRKYKQPGESDYDFIDRIGTTIASAELPSKREEWYNRFFDVVSNLDFIPGGSIMSNAGIPVDIEVEQNGVVREISHHSGGLNNCTAIDVNDSIESIARAAYEFTILTKHRFGIGIDLSPISYRGRPLSRLKGKEEASGVVSMMKLITEGSAEMSVGGSRRGAMLGLLKWNHLDIIDFINCKKGRIVKNVYDPKSKQLVDKYSRPFEHLNISVILDEVFWNNLDNGDDRATKVWSEIAYSAWETGDPGIYFKDTVNKDNPLRDIWGEITTANAC